MPWLHRGAHLNLRPSNVHRRSCPLHRMSFVSSRHALAKRIGRLIWGRRSLLNVSLALTLHCAQLQLWKISCNFVRRFHWITTTSSSNSSLHMRRCRQRPSLSVWRGPSRPPEYRLPRALLDQSPFPTPFPEASIWRQSFAPVTGPALKRFTVTTSGRQWLRPTNEVPD